MRMRLRDRPTRAQTTKIPPVALEDALRRGFALPAPGGGLPECVTCRLQGRADARLASVGIDRLRCPGGHLDLPDPPGPQRK